MNEIMPDPAYEKPPNYRGIRLEDAQRNMPLQRVLDDLKFRGFPSSDDRLLRWRDAGLIGDSLPSGTGNERLIAAVDVQRLNVIADIHQRFGRERMSNADLGFWLAAAEFEVPSYLIAGSIEDATCGFTGLLVRVVGRRLPSSWMLLDKPGDSLIGKASRSISKMVKKNIFVGALPVTQRILETGIGVFIGQVFQPAGLEKHGPRIADLFRRLGIPENQIALWTPVVWGNLVEFAPFFTPGRQNELLKTARAHVAAPPRQMQRAAARATLLTRLYIGVFTEFDNPQFVAGLTPCVAGLILHFKDNPGTEELLERLEQGNTTAINYTIRIFRHVVEAIVAALRGHPIPPTPEPPPDLPP